MTNRIIKFKAWSVYSKEWYSEPFAVSENGKILFHENGDSWDIPGEYEIVQFTGLLDKNGKEIYEGDLIEVRDSGAPVYTTAISWEGNGWWVTDSRGGKYLPNQESREIIGNIYDFPNLLKEKDN